MQSRSVLSGATVTRQDTVPGVEVDEVVELHWMAEPDVSMGTTHRLSAPALCGAWMEPDEPLAAAATERPTGRRYVSCLVCDLLAALA